VTTEYDVSTRGYLRRARTRLDEQAPESLFYAAFELRCGVESRLQEYLEAHRGTIDLRREGWKVAVMAKTLEREFKSGQRIVRLRVLDESQKAVLATWYHTPVTPRLSAMAERLGDYLHAVVPRRSHEDPWWRETRSQLEEVHRALSVAAAGQLLSMPLMNLKTKQVHVKVEISPDKASEILRAALTPGAKSIISVEYLDEAPDELLHGA
jgi:hypothetical protein